MALVFRNTPIDEATGWKAWIVSQHPTVFRSLQQNGYTVLHIRVWEASMIESGVEVPHMNYDHEARTTVGKNWLLRHLPKKELDDFYADCITLRLLGQTVDT